MRYFTLIFGMTLALISCAEASTKDLILTQEKLTYFSPNILNPKYFNFEFGFVITKKIERINYHYNAYAMAYVTEESYTTHEQLRSGALGFKGGVMLPTQPWYPIFLISAIGYAKTALHEDPWFGRREQARETRDLFLVEGGAMVMFGNLIFRLLYQENTVRYFTRKTYISIGVSYN